MLKTRIADPEWKKHGYEDETYWQAYEDSEDPISEYNEQYERFYPVLHPIQGPINWGPVNRILRELIEPSLNEQLNRESFVMKMLGERNETGS